MGGEVLRGDIRASYDQDATPKNKTHLRFPEPLPQGRSLWSVPPRRDPAIHRFPLCVSAPLRLCVASPFLSSLSPLRSPRQVSSWT